MAVAKWVAWCEGIWGFPKIEVSPKNGWFIGENAIKTDDLGGTPISEPPIYLHDTRELLGWIHFRTNQPEIADECG